MKENTNTQQQANETNEYTVMIALTEQLQKATERIKALTDFIVNNYVSNGNNQ